MKITGVVENHLIGDIDALGQARGAGPMSGGHDENEQTLNQLLMELEGFDPQTGIVLLAATAALAGRTFSD